MTEYFGEILCSPKIVKIFFSGIQDLTWLWRDFRLEVINYFDVKEFALAIKLKTEYVSLYGMIQEFCGVELNRDMKKVL
jgi:cation-transporting P-type ATPase D